MSTDNQKVLDDLAAILERAEHEGTTPEEAEVAMNIAMKRASKLGIDLAILRHRYKNRHGDSASASDMITEPVSLIINLGEEGDRSVKDYTSLIGVIVHHFGCKALRISGTNSVQIFGFDSDIDSIIALYNVAVWIMTTSADTAIYKEKAHKSRGINAVTYRKSLYAGFNNRLHERLSEMRNEAKMEAEQESSETALALIDRDKDVMAFYHSEIQKMENTRVVKQYNRYRANAEAYQHGSERANSVPLSPNRNNVAKASQRAIA